MRQLLKNKFNLLLITLLLLALTAELTLDPVLFKGNIIQQVHQNTALQLDFADAEYSPYKPGEVSFSDVSLRSEDGEFDLSLGSVYLAFDVSSLLDKDIIVRDLTLKELNVTTSQAFLDGLANQGQQQEDEPPAKDEAPLPINLLLLEQVELLGVNLDLKRPDGPVSLSNLHLVLKDLLLVEAGQMKDLPGLSQTKPSIEITGDEFRFAQYSAQAIKVQGEIEDQQLVFAPLSLAAHGAELSLNTKTALLDEGLTTSLNSNTLTLDIGEQHRALIPGEIWPQGKLSVELDMQIAPVAETPLRTLSGQAKLLSNGLTVHGIDLDAILQGLQESEQTSLLDVGSFLVTGPLGLIASQVANLGAAGLSVSGGQTQFGQVLADVQIEQGVVQVKDVAFATGEFRAAFDGQFNVPEMAFEDMQFYLLDENHCATVQQTLNGRVDSPEGVTGALATTTVVKPFTNILEQAGQLISDCKPVYAGAVDHPLEK